jgi:hypothetical protein
VYMGVCLGVISGKGSGKGKDAEEWIAKTKRIKICNTYTYEGSIMKPTKHCLKEGKQRGREGEMEI